MTRRAAGLLIIAAGLYLFANQVQVGWLYVFEAVVLALLIVSPGLPWLALAGLHVERRLEDGQRAIFQDDAVTFTLRVHNPRPWARYFVTLRETCPLAPPGERQRAWFFVRLGRDTEVTYQTRAYKRGRYTLPAPVLESAGPFGIFRVRRGGDGETGRWGAGERGEGGDLHPVTVYPRHDGWRGALAALDRAVAEAATDRAGEGYELYGTREFRHGDSVRQVDWRGTARRTRLIVREREQVARATVEAVLDTRREWGEGRETTLEYAIRLVAAAADSARRHGYPFRLRDGGAAPAGWWPLLDHLAGVQPGNGPGLATLLADCSPNAIVIVPLAALEAPVLDALAALVRRGGRVIPIVLTGFGAPGEGRLASALEGIGLAPIVLRWGLGAQGWRLESDIRRPGRSPGPLGEG